jgi:hypothetical protein
MSTARGGHGFGHRWKAAPYVAWDALRSWPRAGWGGWVTAHPPTWQWIADMRHSFRIFHSVCRPRDARGMSRWDARLIPDTRPRDQSGVGPVGPWRARNRKTVVAPRGGTPSIGRPPTRLGAQLRGAPHVLGTGGALDQRLRPQLFLILLEHTSVVSAHHNHR